VAIKHLLTYLLKWIELVFAMMVATEDSYFVLDGCIRWWSESTIKWTGWTLAMTSPWWQHHKHCQLYYYY